MLSDKEQAAIYLCGGMLSDCYILAEIVDSMMVETMYKIKQQPWFKHEIKKDFNTAVKTLRTIIKSATYRSPTSPEYMREVADAYYELLEDDVKKLTYAIRLELGKQGVPNNELVSEMVSIYIMLLVINTHYKDAIACMKKAYYMPYESWFTDIHCKSVNYWWYKGIQVYISRITDANIDLNDSQSIHTGIKVIQNKIMSKELSLKVQEIASQYAVNNTADIFEKAVNILKS